MHKSNQLIGIKLALLLHDPPNKMWVSARRIKHEDVAKEFAERILKQTQLKHLYDEAVVKHRETIRLADSIAASFDRWLLTDLERRYKQEYFVEYEFIHNIFDPRYSTILKVDHTKDVVSELIRVGDSINEFLKSVQERSENLPEDKRLIILYNTLYAILEPMWYYNGFPPSLADTRAPTHSIFDHLYASASVANILVKGESQGNLEIDEFEGYYVVLDYPGIQKFVSAGRKTGDFWASSWILSNVMWRLALSFANQYGFDVILTPTPRLNPYTFRSILTMINNDGILNSFYGMMCNDLPDIDRGLEQSLEERICEMIASLYGVNNIGPRKWSELNMLMHQPLIPATITLLLPGDIAETPEELAEHIQNEYRRAWRELYDFITNSLKEKVSSQIERDLPHAIISKYLENAEKILETPPHGLRIYIVKIKRVYQDIEECIVNNREDVCEKLGLKPNRENLQELISKETLHESTRWLSRRLVYHILVTRWSLLIRDPDYGYYSIPIPRCYVYYDAKDGQFNRLPKLDSDTTCSLCGEEPAILKFGKTYDTHVGVSYDRNTIDKIKEIAGVTQIDHNQLQDLSKIIKPGETLGPYCLLKRAVYQVFRDKLGILSTDDIALLRVSRISMPEKSMFKELIERVREMREDLNGDKLAEIMKHLYRYQNTGMTIKDIEDSANALGYSFEEFVRVAREAFTKACIEVSNANNKEELLRSVIEIYGLWSLQSSCPERIASKIVRGNVEKLCEALKIPTTYAVLRGDADNIGKLLRGSPLDHQRIDEFLQYYISTIYKSITERGEIRSHTARSESGDLIKLAYDESMKVIQILGLEAVPVSPSWQFAVSLSLLLTAIEDFKITRELDGLLVYSGGDDVFAFYPVQTAMRAAYEHRKRFLGDGFKYVGNKIPVASSLTTGRSLSARFCNLKDIMSEEASIAYELLESHAKNAEWFSPRIKKSWRKDSLVVSDSRSGEVTVLPQRVWFFKNGSEDKYIYPYIDTLISSLVFGIVSRNMPEDLEGFMEGNELVLEEGLSEIIQYILKRNIRSRDARLHEYVCYIIENLGKDNVLYEVARCIGDKRVSLAIEFYLKLFRILRRHIG